AREVQRLLSTCANLQIVQGEVAEIITLSTGVSPMHSEEYGRDAHATVESVVLADGTRLMCGAVVVTTGTFLRALMHTGERKTEGGRVGEATACGLSGCLERLGLELGRLKTGTPPRLARETIDFDRFEVQPGDQSPAPFSYLNEYRET